MAQLVVEGLRNRDIAKKLLMGTETVKTHVSNILRKTGAANRTMLAAALSERTLRREST